MENDRDVGGVDGEMRTARPWERHGDGSGGLEDEGGIRCGLGLGYKIMGLDK